MSESSTLLLTETGVEYLPDGSVAVNVGPIVRALKFLTEGRGDDRGTDEQGNPLPDLMSLAFAVVESIILGGRKAESFRQVMRELEAKDDTERSSLSLAKEARRVQRTTPTTALDHAAVALEDMLAELRGAALDEQGSRDAAQALEAFRAFGADRWLSASAQLLVALRALGALRPTEAEPEPRRARSKKRRAASTPKLPSAVKPAPRPRARVASAAAETAKASKAAKAGKASKAAKTVKKKAGKPAKRRSRRR